LTLRSWRSATTPSSGTDSCFTPAKIIQPWWPDWAIVYFVQSFVLN
jgi:hypothetical protein